METLKDIIAENNRLEDKLAKKQLELEKVKEVVARLYERSNWVTSILLPLARLIKKERGYYKYEILGPFGLTCETSIWFWKTKDDHQGQNLHNVVSLTFRPHHKVVGENEYRSSVVLVGRTGIERFPEGTIGQINGFNKSEIACEDWSLEQIILFMDEMNKKDLVVSN